MKKRIVIAIGGNALGTSPAEQHQLVRQTARYMVDLIEAGNQIVITHGNGPQVGMISLAMEEAAGSAVHTPEMPIPECGAMSQGYIGYHMQNAIQEELLKRKIGKSVASIVSQVLVERDDPDFQHPTKPICPFLS
jgi:carbamate kinase